MGAAPTEEFRTLNERGWSLPESGCPEDALHKLKFYKLKFPKSLPFKEPSGGK
jgi:hypothetical protein